jgi:hypothetical protein
LRFLTTPEKRSTCIEYKVLEFKEIKLIMRYLSVLF